MLSLRFQTYLSGRFCYHFYLRNNTDKYLLKCKWPFYAISTLKCSSLGVISLVILKPYQARGTVPEITIPELLAFRIPRDHYKMAEMIRNWYASISVELLRAIKYVISIGTATCSAQLGMVFICGAWFTIQVIDHRWHASIEDYIYGSQASRGTKLNGTVYYIYPAGSPALYHVHCSLSLFVSAPQVHWTTQTSRERASLASLLALVFTLTRFSLFPSMGSKAFLICPTLLIPSRERAKSEWGALQYVCTAPLGSLISPPEFSAHSLPFL